MKCPLCHGEGVVIELRELWPVFATDEKPTAKRERRIICPRCDGEGIPILRRLLHEYEDH